MAESLQMSTYAKNHLHLLSYSNLFSHDMQLKEEKQPHKQHLAEYNRDLHPRVHCNLCFDACISLHSHVPISDLQYYK